MGDSETLAGKTPPSALRGSFDIGVVLSAELDRVGVSLKTAELGDAVVAGTLGGLVWIMGVIAHPGDRRNWEGSEEQAVSRLAGLPDNAGAEVFWEAFSDP
ncbi:MAG: hypothetical protein ACXVRK_08430 [Gaiellaceae bacterium]